MGCFPGCFGRRKNRRRQKRRESFQPRLNRISEGSSEGSTKDVNLNLKVASVKEVPKVSEGFAKVVHLNVEEVPKVSEDDLKVSTVEEDPKVSEESVKEDHLNFKVEEVPKVSEICDKAEEKSSSSPIRKRVTFDSKVKTYEHIAVEESVEFSEEEKPVKSRLVRCSSEGSDITSSGSSYPSNHRYQNCRESDDEEEEDVTDCEDIDDEDEDDEEDGGLLHEDYYNDDGDYEDKLHNWDKQVYTEEIADNVLDIEKIEEKSKGCHNASLRDRSGYVNAVLNPIENLSQWKAVKSKGSTTTQAQIQTRKENANASSFSLEEPQSRDDETKKQRRTQEEVVVAVDASLSTWLSTSQTTTSECSSVFSLDVGSATYDKKKYSKTVQSHDERPVLCALTAEDIKQFSATNSPRKSPSRSPESPIIGTVGGYWNSPSMATSKYSEV